MISRITAQKILKSKKSCLLLGPRQTGKSTLIKSLKPELKINLARESEFLRYSSHVGLFTEELEASPAKTVFVDEIQRIPALLNSIQALIDDAKTETQQRRFFLTGSSARKLRRGQANLLPGRINSYELGGLSARELDYDVSFERALNYGFLPEPYLEGSKTDAEKLLRSYSATYLKEEIQAEALTRNIQGFARFLTILASSAAEIVDFSKVATKSKVARSSTIRFVEILEDTLIAQRVPSYEKIEGADVIKHPKLYFFDGGVLNGLTGNFSLSPEVRGKKFEQLIYSQIRNSAMALDVPCEISFFRTRHGLEVDFIVRVNEKTWAIEVKSGEIDNSELSNLKRLRDYGGDIDFYVAVGPKEKRRLHDGILVCNWLTLLSEMGL